jgi:hypothetical protein
MRARLAQPSKAWGSVAQGRDLGKARCRFHGGLSTGPKTQAGRARIAQMQRQRWAVGERSRIEARPFGVGLDDGARRRPRNRTAARADRWHLGLVGHVVDPEVDRVLAVGAADEQMLPLRARARGLWGITKRATDGNKASAPQRSRNTGHCRIFLTFEKRCYRRQNLEPGTTRRGMERVNINSVINDLASAERGASRRP